MEKIKRPYFIFNFAQLLKSKSKGKGWKLSFCALASLAKAPHLYRRSVWYGAYECLWFPRRQPLMNASPELSAQTF